jgi:hypothetical protein
MSFPAVPAIITSEVTSLESINFHSYRPSSISTGFFVFKSIEGIENRIPPVQPSILSPADRLRQRGSPTIAPPFINAITPFILNAWCDRFRTAIIGRYSNLIGGGVIGRSRAESTARSLFEFDRWWRDRSEPR